MKILTFLNFYTKLQIMRIKLFKRIPKKYSVFFGSQKSLISEDFRVPKKQGGSHSSFILKDGVSWLF